MIKIFTKYLIFVKLSDIITKLKKTHIVLVRETCARNSVSWTFEVLWRKLNKKGRNLKWQ